MKPIGIIVLAVIIGITITACDNNSTNSGTDSETGGSDNDGSIENPERSLIFTGENNFTGSGTYELLEGLLEVIISNNRAVNHERTFYISTGDSYVIRLNGVVISRGTVSVYSPPVGVFEGTTWWGGSVRFNDTFIHSAAYRNCTGALSGDGNPNSVGTPGTLALVFPGDTGGAYCYPRW